jgi:hypothetical protein
LSTDTTHTAHAKDANDTPYYKPSIKQQDLRPARIQVQNREKSSMATQKSIPELFALLNLEWYNPFVTSNPVFVEHASLASCPERYRDAFSEMYPFMHLTDVSDSTDLTDPILNDPIQSDSRDVKASLHADTMYWRDSVEFDFRRRSPKRYVQRIDWARFNENIPDFLTMMDCYECVEFWCTYQTLEVFVVGHKPRGIGCSPSGLPALHDAYLEMSSVISARLRKNVERLKWLLSFETSFVANRNDPFFQWFDPDTVPHIRFWKKLENANSSNHPTRSDSPNYDGGILDSPNYAPTSPTYNIPDSPIY